MAELKATFEIRNDRRETHPTEVPDGGHGSVHVSEDRRREITCIREITSVEDAVWAIEAEEHQIIWDLWEHVDGDEFDDWGFRSPYPSGGVSVSLNHEISIHDVVWNIAQREGAEPAGVYLDLLHNRRLHGDMDGGSMTRRVSGLCRYLEAVGIDLSYWTHGRDGLTKMNERRFPASMLAHAREQSK